MANEINQFGRSLEKWAGLMNDGHLSAPAHIGKIAIMYDGVLPEDADYTTRFHENEAYTLHRIIADTGKSTKVYDRLCEQSFEEVLTDDRVSDMIIIGHGTFSAIEKGCADQGYYGWYKAARTADHVKTGKIWQRTCAKFPHNRLPVPFGTFIVNDHRNIYMPFNDYFAPEYNLNEEIKIKPVTKQRRLRLKTILDWDAATRRTSD